MSNSGARVSLTFTSHYFLNLRKWPSPTPAPRDMLMPSLSSVYLQWACVCGSYLEEDLQLGHDGDRRQHVGTLFPGCSPVLLWVSLLCTDAFLSVLLLWHERLWSVYFTVNSICLGKSWICYTGECSKWRVVTFCVCKMRWSKCVVRLYMERPFKQPKAGLYWHVLFRACLVYS